MLSKFSKLLFFKILASIFTMLLSFLWFEDVMLHKINTDFSAVTLLFFVLISLFATFIIIFWKKEKFCGENIFLVLCTLGITYLIFFEYFFIITPILFIFLVVILILFRLVKLHRIAKIIKTALYFGIVPFLFIIILSAVELMMGGDFLLTKNLSENVLGKAYVFSSSYAMLVSFFVPFFILDFAYEEKRRVKIFSSTIGLILVAVFLSSNSGDYIIKKKLDPCYEFIPGKGASWYIKDGHICIEDGTYMKMLHGADSESFKEYSGYYFGDKNHIYYNSRIIHGADPETFNVINKSEYAKTLNNVYYAGNELQGADAKTFRLISDFYYGDDSHVYRYGKIVSEADPETFQSLNSYSYARDAKNIFYRGEKIEDATADAATIKVLKNDDYAKTSNKVYLCGKEMEVADTETFELIFDEFARDKYAVYYHGKKYYDADPEKFRRMGRSKFYTDDKRIYYDSEIVENVNRETFQVVNEVCGTDGKNYFNGSIMIEKSCVEDDFFHKLNLF